MTIRKIILTIFLSVFATPYAVSQATDKTIIIPHNNHNLTPILDVYIGEKGPFKFVIDTGASYSSISRSLADELNLTYEEQNSLSTLTTNDIVYEDVSLGLDLYLSHQKIHRKTDIYVTDIQFNNLTKARGILGVAQFQNGIIENFPKEEHLQLTLPEKTEACKFFSKHRKCTSNSYVLSGRKFSLGGESGDLIIDTGNQGPKAIALFKNQYTNELWDKYHRGLSEVRLSGLSDKPLRLLRTPNFSIDGKNCVGEILLRDPSDKAPLIHEFVGFIGWSALESYPFKIDYKHNNIDLKMSTCPHDKVKTIGISSLSFSTDFQYVYVNGLIEGSPADEVGIKRGDKIEKIILADDKVITKFDNSIYQWNDQHVYAQPGSKVTYFIRRNGELKPYVMTAEDLNLVELE